MATVRLYAAASVAAGNRTELSLAAATFPDLLDQLEQLHGPAMARVISRCSFLIDGLVVHDRTADVSLPPAATVDVLPPFAGG